MLNFLANSSTSPEMSKEGENPEASKFPVVKCEIENKLKALSKLLPAEKLENREKAMKKMYSSRELNVVKDKIENELKQAWKSRAEIPKTFENILSIRNNLICQGTIIANAPQI